MSAQPSFLPQQAPITPHRAPQLPTPRRSVWRETVAALRPGWAAATIVLLLCAWRLAMLAARGVLEPDALQGMDGAQTTALVKGVTWDVFLGLGTLLLLRSMTLAAASAAVLSNTRRRVLIGIQLLAGLLVVVSTVLRASDLGHCYLARSHFSAESFLYLEIGYGDRLATGRGVGFVLATLLAGGLLWRAVRRDLQRASGQTAPRLRFLPALGRTEVIMAVALIGLVLVGRVVRDAQKFPPHEFELRVVPELNFARQWRIFAQDAADRAHVQVPPVPAATWQRWQTAGLVPEGARPDQPYPLYRQGLGEPPVAFPRRAHAPERPDVVLTLMESVNRVFVDDLSGHFRGLMPNLGRLSRQMTVVEGYWNTTSPTIAGTVASLCSLYSPIHPGDVNGRSPVFGNARYLCMAEVLRAAGYRTAFIQGADLVGANTDKFLVAHGFDEVLADSTLARRFPAGAKTEMGYHDADVLVLAKEYIERMEALKAKDGRPFFVVVATLDTHEPGLGGADCQLPRRADGQFAVADVPADPSGQQTLAAYHCSDKALGLFGDFLLAPGRGEHLLWAVTADHAAFRTLANDSVFEGIVTGWSFDRLPLLIHDPIHELPAHVNVLSGSLDVAPTLLHLLGQDAGPTDMIGRSVFGSRPQHPFLAGRIGVRKAFIKTAEDEYELPFAEVRTLCARHQPLLPTPTPVTACDLALWFDWQDSLWALRRLAPPADRDGPPLTAGVTAQP